MDIFWKTATGDDLRIADLGTEHPHLQATDRVEGWADCNPRSYPASLFALCVALLEILDEHELLAHQSVIDAGISLENTEPLRSPAGQV